MDADETGEVLELLLEQGGNDVLRYLWMSSADPMECPLKPRLWVEIVPGSMGQPAVEILSLMIETRRW
ncbi:MAG: hypothetical protein WBZ29_13600 [Methanocella sp.]